MSEVKRYWVPCGVLVDQSGWHQDDNEVVLAGEHDAALDAQRLRADTAEADLQEVCKTVDAVTTSLVAAEQRIAELEKDAARYQWLRDKSQNHHQFYLSTPLYFTGVKFSKENVDSTIDAALNPNPEAESHE